MDKLLKKDKSKINSMMDKLIEKDKLRDKKIHKLEKMKSEKKKKK